MDETLALPSEKAVKIALRTQQVIAHETGVLNTVDPLAGSYFVEALTDKMEAEAEVYFEEIERRGGMIACVEEGYPQREIAKAAYQFQREIEDKQRVIVGVNDYVEEDEKIDIPMLRIDRETETEQCAALKSVREKRDDAEVKRTLEVLRNVARGEGNTFEAILECARAYVSLGEMCDVLRDEWGEYVEPPSAMVAS
jgi:methylmalonyl-CoA mutase N-terminal domain/subunit